MGGLVQYIRHIPTAMGGSFVCGFAVSPLEVHQKSPLDFVVQQKMLGQAPENHQKNTGIKQQKKINSGYPSPTESTRKSSGSVKTSSHSFSLLFPPHFFSSFPFPPLACLLLSRYPYEKHNEISWGKE